MLGIDTVKPYHHFPVQNNAEFGTLYLDLGKFAAF